MKLICIMLTFWTLSSFSVRAQGLFIRPEALKPGDKVMIVSPSSTPKPEYVTGAEEVLSAWGLVPVRGAHVLANANGTYAGTPQERLDDLIQALTNPEIKAIFCSRGGHGSVQEMQLLSPEIIRKNPKWLIGYSDITAMHSTWQSAGVMSLHGPMGAHLNEHKGMDEETQIMHKMLMNQSVSYTFPGHELNKVGQVKGRLFGGNLSVYDGVSGSYLDCLQHFDKNEPVILFIEEVEESFERVNRMVNHLKLLGVFDRVQGVIFGQFTDYEKTGAWPSEEHMVAEILKDCSIPIAFGFPSGHGDVNYPLIMGAEVELTVSKDQLQLKFAD